MKKILPLFLLLIGCGQTHPPKTSLVSDSDRRFEVPETQIPQISPEKAAQIRKNPQTAQIADTINTVELTCHKQGASFRVSPQHEAANCLVGNEAIFNVILEDEVVIGVDTYYEDKKIEDVVSLVSERLGSADYDERTKSYHWLYGNFIMGLCAYDKGVRTRVIFIGNKGFPLSDTKDANPSSDNDPTPVIELDTDI